MVWLAKILLCIAVMGICLYAYVEQENGVTELAREIPLLEKELAYLEEKIQHSRFLLDQFESPKGQLEWLAEPEYSHLKFVSEEQTLIVPREP